jgi:hypothetical protein
MKTKEAPVFVPAAKPEEKGVYADINGFSIESNSLDEDAVNEHFAAAVPKNDT